MLETRHLTVRFGGHVAVNAISCCFEPGTLTAIVGPNGAGKTTYFNLISGQLPATNGTVHLNGRELSHLSASARTRAGLGRSFQLTNLFPNLSVLENVRLAVQAARDGAHLRGLNLWRIWSDHADLMERALDILTVVSMHAQKDVVVASLSHGDQRKLEVALLIALEPSVYMFDEPTAGMSKSETSRFISLIRKVTEGKTLLTVEHDMGVVFGLADKIAVVVYGEVLAFDTPEAVRANAKVQEAYLGSAVAEEQAGQQAGGH